MSIIWEVVASLALIFLTLVVDLIRASHLSRISTGEALSDALMSDSCACKAFLKCNISLEETSWIWACKASIPALGGCICLEETPWI